MCIRDRACTDAQKLTAPEVSGFAALPGNGLAAKLDGVEIFGGNASFIGKMCIRDRAKGHCAAAVQQAADAVGPLGLGGKLPAGVQVQQLSLIHI